jgi:lipopolysaccharide export system permease protein
MRRILDRYVLTECLPPFGISLAVFAFVLLMHRLLILTDLVVASGVPVVEVLRLLGLALPTLLPLILPVSLLLAVLLGIGRLSADSEVVAMRAGGVGLAGNLRPVMVLSAAACAVTAAATVWAQPLAVHSFKQVLFDSVMNRVSVAIQTGVFTEITGGITVYAGGIDDRTEAMEDLFLHLGRGSSSGMWIFARSGSFRAESGTLTLNLNDGEMHERGGHGRPYRLLRFREYQLRIPLPTSVWSPDVQEARTSDLLDRVLSHPSDTAARLELHRRLALPASCLVFGVLGAALGLHHARHGRGRGVSLCLAVLLAFYALLTAGRAMGEKGVLAPELAMWMPDLVLGAVAAAAFVRKNREAPLPLEEILGRWLSRIRRPVRVPEIAP